MNDLLRLERVITLKKLVQWEPGRTDLNCMPVFASWAGKNVNQDGVGLQMAQVEIVDGILKTEQSVVDWCIGGC